MPTEFQGEHPEPGDHGRKLAYEEGVINKRRIGQGDERRARGRRQLNSVTPGPDEERELIPVIQPVSTTYAY